MGSEIQSQTLPRDPRSIVELYHGIRLDHGSNTAVSREIFWDHISDFGIHGHVCSGECFILVSENVSY